MAQTQNSASKEHRQRKNPRSAELWREAKKARNAERGPQVWVESTLDGKLFSYEELVAMTDEQVDRVVLAHWENR